jgi:outer membrane lipoprotein-sorting protein
MKQFLHRCFATLVLFTAAALSFGQTEPTAHEIMERVFERPQPDDLEGSLTMTLENSRGDQRVRSVRQYIAQFAEGEKKILFFTAPADVRDTAFMNWSYTDPSRSDDQWIYLPALRSIRRISAEKKQDSFMGSDFTYDDLGERRPDLDTHRIIGTENIDGRTVYVVESVPQAGTSAYGSTRSWVASEIWIGLRREFLDSSGALLKTLEIDEYREIDGFMTITRMTMTDAKSGHSTMMELSDLRFNTGISEQTFTERTMTRGIR